MWPFKRKVQTFNEVPAMPPELNHYYQAEKRQRSVMTWLLGFATLAVTIAVAFLLFFSARFLIGKIRGGRVNAPVATQGTDSSTVTQNPTQPGSDSTTTSTATASSTAPTTTTTGTTTAAEPGGHTSSTSTTLPNTGPGQTAAVFLVAAATGTLAYRLTARRRQTSYS